MMGDDAFGRARIRARLGAHPVFVKRDAPAWDRWARWCAGTGETMPPAMQTISGFGGYFRSAEPPDDDRAEAAS